MLKEYLFILGMFFALSYFHILRKEQSQHCIKCGLWVVGCGLWVVGCGLWIVDCRLWIVDCVFDDFSYDFHLLPIGSL